MYRGWFSQGRSEENREERKESSKFSFKMVLSESKSRYTKYQEVQQLEGRWGATRRRITFQRRVRRWNQWTCTFQKDLKQMMSRDYELQKVLKSRFKSRLEASSLTRVSEPQMLLNHQRSKPKHLMRKALHILLCLTYKTSIFLPVSTSILYCLSVIVCESWQTVCLLPLGFFASYLTWLSEFTSLIAVDAARLSVRVWSRAIIIFFSQ